MRYRMLFRTILIVNKMFQASPALVKNQIPPEQA